MGQRLFLVRGPALEILITVSYAFRESCFLVTAKRRIFCNFDDTLAVHAVEVGGGVWLFCGDIGIIFGAMPRVM